MRRALWILVLLLGCGDKQNPPNPPSDSGIDGGVDGGVDGGTDGGVDGGTDGGMPCTNTVESHQLDPRCHIGAVDGCETWPYTSNPPVSGRHYPIWARWQIHTQVVPREYYVHNLEHGGVILLYRPDASQSVKDALVRAFNATPVDPACDLDPACAPLGCPTRRLVLTEDPLLPTDVPWAATVSGWEVGHDPPGLGLGYVMKGNCVDEPGLVEFAVTHRDHSAETTCYPGEYPP